MSARERLAADRGEAHLIWAAYVLYGDPRRIFFGAAEAPADRMLYGEESAETATAGASPALTRSAAPIVHRAAAPTWLVGVGLAALVLAAIPAGLWLNRTLYPTGTPHPFEYKGVAPIAVTSEYVEGLELYRLGDYDGAWAIFMRQAATRPADPVLAGLVRAARNRSLAGAEEQRTARIDVLLADLAELMKAPPVPPSDLDDWSSPVLTAVLDALEAAPENTAGGMDIAVMEYLEEALLAHPRLSVLERRHLDRLLNEIRLNKLGLSDPAEAERTARLKLVRLWFFPSLTVEGGKSVLSLSAVWENSETLFILRQELSSDPRETAAGMMAQLSPKLREALPIRGLLLEQTPDGWWCNVGGDHGVTPETRFRPVGAAGVTLSVRAVEPRRALLDAGGASLLVGARIQQID
ncbi:hypothetical protein HS125_08705 [bacterium]|nr:hypothetical protein [bacterium]